MKCFQLPCLSPSFILSLNFSKWPTLTVSYRRSPIQQRHHICSLGVISFRRDTTREVFSVERVRQGYSAGSRTFHRSKLPKFAYSWAVSQDFSPEYIPEDKYGHFQLAAGSKRTPQQIRKADSWSVSQNAYVSTYHVTKGWTPTISFLSVKNCQSTLPKNTPRDVFPRENRFL